MSDANLTDLLEAAGAAIASRIPLERLARVVSYSPPPRDLVVVIPVLATSVNGVPMPPKQLQDLPVQWPGGAGGGITWPLRPGDLVELVPQDADCSAVLAGGADGQVPPTARRRDLAASHVRPLAPRAAGGLPAGAYADSGPVLHGSQIWLVSSTAGDMVALASKVLTELQAIKTYLGTMTMTAGTLTAPTGGGQVTGVSGPPVSPMPDPGSVASTKAHVE